MQKQVKSKLALQELSETRCRTQRTSALQVRQFHQKTEALVKYSVIILTFTT